MCAWTIGRGCCRFKAFVVKVGRIAVMLQCMLEEDVACSENLLFLSGYRHTDSVS